MSILKIWLGLKGSRSISLSVAHGTGDQDGAFKDKKDYVIGLMGLYLGYVFQDVLHSGEPRVSAGTELCLNPHQVISRALMFTLKVTQH